jgi:hypothetical protein
MMTSCCQNPPNLCGCGVLEKALSTGTVFAEKHLDMTEPINFM